MGKSEDRIQKMRSKQKHIVVSANDPVAAKASKKKPTPPKPLPVELTPVLVETPVVKKQKPNWRLPDGSTFAATYDAEKVLWTGHLIIPGLEAFRTEQNTLFGLFQKLDRKYRKVLRQERKENP